MLHGNVFIVLNHVSHLIIHTFISSFNAYLDLTLKDPFISESFNLIFFTLSGIGTLRVKTPTPCMKTNTMSCSSFLFRFKHLHNRTYKTISPNVCLTLPNHALISLLLIKAKIAINELFCNL